MAICSKCGAPWTGFGMTCNICKHSEILKDAQKQQERDQKYRDKEAQAQAYRVGREREQQDQQRHQDYLELENQRVAIEQERLAVERERLQLQREQALNPEDIYTQTKASIQKLDLIWYGDDSFSFPNSPYLDARLVSAFESAHKDFMAESPLQSELQTLHALRKKQIDLLLSDIKTALLNDEVNQVFESERYSTLLDSPSLRVRWPIAEKITLCEKNHFLNVECSFSVTIGEADATRSIVIGPTELLCEDLDTGELSIDAGAITVVVQPELSDYIAEQFKDVLPVLNQRKKRRELALNERLQAEKERLQTEKERQIKSYNARVYMMVFFASIAVFILFII